MIGNYLAQKWGEAYDPKRTHAYLLVMADHQLGLIKPPKKAIDDSGLTGPVTDGLGSASAAAAFGAREFTQQSSRTWQLQWHHTAGKNPRPQHLEVAGQVANASEGFDVAPGIGAPGCGCYVEPINPVGTVTGLTPEMLDAIRAYTFDPWINQGLRRGGLTSLNAAGQKQALALKNAVLRQAVTKREMTVYRAVDGDVYDDAVGTTYKDQGFVSTTRDQFLADDITSELTDGKVVEITIPEGSRVLEITDEMSSFEEMQEVLLPLASRYTVEVDGTLTFLGREAL
jgi:hypothetical protein